MDHRGSVCEDCQIRQGRATAAVGRTDGEESSEDDGVPSRLPHLRVGLVGSDVERKVGVEHARDVVATPGVVVEMVAVDWEVRCVPR